MNQCKAEFHSLDGKDSLPFSSNKLFCRQINGHEGVHTFYGGLSSIIDNREFCSCKRCNPVVYCGKSHTHTKRCLQ